MNRQDFYKATMANVYRRQFGVRKHTCTFGFKSRGNQKLGCLANLFPTGPQLPPMTCTKAQAEYLKGKGIADADSFMNLSECNVVCRDKDGDLEYRVSGFVEDATWFEIDSLSKIQEAWSDRNGWTNDKDILVDGMKRLEKKVGLYNTLPKQGIGFIEMGTRRAFSKAWHTVVTDYLAKNLNAFVGTSNIGLAIERGYPCIGTMAHEIEEAGQVLSPDITKTQEFILRAWANEYKGKYGIALTDCLGIDCFLREFDEELSNLYTGVRHDSGDPFTWGNKMLAHYENMGINPRTKDVCFSNSLNPEMVFKLVDAFYGKFRNIYFGIGTDFTYDLVVKGLNIVMKMLEFDGLPVAKISDDAGKGMCENQSYVNWLKAKNWITL
ncbi:MAG: hypothetical protein M0P12_01605 [Paludibacteraceae bacterium]|nr:hypothetical protein [Paludibacteraceae bacterium]